MAVLTIAIVGGAAYVGWKLFHDEVALVRVEPDTASPDPAAGTTDPAAGSTARARVAAGDDYYVFVKLIELTPKRGEDNWDAGGSNPPDIFFELFWNDAKVFESVARDDAIIAEWDLIKLDVKDALLSGQVEIASAINAPLVSIDEYGILKLHIYDDDAMSNDDAGKIELPMISLQPGLNTIKPAGTYVSRILIDMVPRSTPLPQLLERASDR